MKRAEVFGALVFGVVVLAGCAAGERYDQAAASTSGGDASAAVEMKSGGGEELAQKGLAIPKDANGQIQMASFQIQQRAVVRKAQIQIRVDDVEAAEKKVNRTVDEVGGYVDNVTSSDLASDRPTLTVTARVPVGAFARAMDSFESLGTRLSKSVSAEDVTERLVDMDARMRTMLAQEEAFRNMLKSQRSMSNTIELQRQLMELRGEIESIAAQRKSLGGQAALSTIEVTLQQKADAVAAATKDTGALSDSWGQAWSAATAFFRNALVVGFYVVAFSPAWLLAIFVGLYLRRANARARTSG